MTTLIAAVDGFRARLFRLDRDDSDPAHTRRVLVEVEDLVNPSRRERDHNLFSDSRPGLRRAGANGPDHGVDDHRGGHNAELTRRFVTEIVDAVYRHAQRTPAPRIVVAAAPEMLGSIRAQVQRVGDSVVIVEHPKQLTNLPPQELHDRLAADGVIAPRRDDR